MNIIDRESTRLTCFEVYERLSNGRNNAIMYEDFQSAQQSLQDELVSLGESAHSFTSDKINRRVVTQDERRVSALHRQLKQLQSLKQAAFVRSKTLRYLRSMVVNHSADSIMAVRSHLRAMIKDITPQEELLVINHSPDSSLALHLMIPLLSDRLQDGVTPEQVFSMVQDHIPKVQNDEDSALNYDVNDSSVGDMDIDDESGDDVPQSSPYSEVVEDVDVDDGTLVQET